MAKAPEDPAIVWDRKLDKLPRGKALAREIVRRQNGDKRVLVAFSCGKDSIGSALELKECGLDLYPFFRDSLPGRTWVDETLEYYEKNLFGGRKICYMVHNGFWRHMRDGMLQTPNGLADHAATEWPNRTWEEEQDLARKHFKLPASAFTAIGVRASDSAIRRVCIQKNGVINSKTKTFYPIWDLKPTQVIDRIAAAGLKLPKDYRMWNKTLDGVTSEYIIGLKYRGDPRDWELVKQWYPGAEVQLFYYDMLHGKGAAQRHAKEFA